MTDNIIDVNFIFKLIINYIIELYSIMLRFYSFLVYKYLSHIVKDKDKDIII